MKNEMKPFFRSDLRCRHRQCVDVCWTEWKEYLSPTLESDIGAMNFIHHTFTVHTHKLVHLSIISISLVRSLRVCLWVWVIGTTASRQRCRGAEGTRRSRKNWREKVETKQWRKRNSRENERQFSWVFYDFYSLLAFQRRLFHIRNGKRWKKNPTKFAQALAACVCICSANELNI